MSLRASVLNSIAAAWTAASASAASMLPIHFAFEAARYMVHVDSGASAGVLPTHLKRV